MLDIIDKYLISVDADVRETVERTASRRCASSASCANGRRRLTGAGRPRRCSSRRYQAGQFRRFGHCGRSGLRRCYSMSSAPARTTCRSPSSAILTAWCRIGSTTPPPRATRFTPHRRRDGSSSRHRRRDRGVRGRQRHHPGLVVGRHGTRELVAAHPAVLRQPPSRIRDLRRRA